MAGRGNNLPDTRELYPEMLLNLISGTALKLPEEFRQGYAVFLLNRRHCLPFCSEQPADFRTKTNDFDSEEVNIFAGSVDPFNKREAMLLCYKAGTRGLDMMSKIMKTMLKTHECLGQ